MITKLTEACCPCTHLGVSQTRQNGGEEILAVDAQLPQGPQALLPDHGGRVGRLLGQLVAAPVQVALRDADLSVHGGGSRMLTLIRVHSAGDAVLANPVPANPVLYVKFSLQKLRCRRRETVVRKSSSSSNRLY